jgi:hypothetical protein
LSSIILKIFLDNITPFYYIKDMKQLFLFEKPGPRLPRLYSNVITASINRKGVLDVDTVKGCTLGMAAYPNGGCYGECYAYKNAKTYGFNFRQSISRQFMGREHKGTIIKEMNRHAVGWYRVGTAGDPCHDWTHTVAICWALWHTKKIPVIITKHWAELSDAQIEKLRHLRAAVNTSVSGMDTDYELRHRIGQLKRLRAAGVSSVCRVVTCQYGNSLWARGCRDKQDYLLSLTPIIDNPLRARKSSPRVLNGDIVLTRKNESVGGGKYVSLNERAAYLGECRDCPDQCGVDPSAISEMEKERQNEDQASGTLFF